MMSPDDFKAVPLRPHDRRNLLAGINAKTKEMAQPLSGGAV